MLRYFSRCLLAPATALLIMSPAVAAPDTPDACPTARMAPLSLPKVRNALATNSELTIVAFGSSSTQGWHASSIAQSYPAVLQAELSAALPNAHVAVINRGVGGQDAAEMMLRIDQDVSSIRPILVIWQVGANGAMKNRDPEQLRTLLVAGVHTLKDAGIDVVLMDNQRAPAILASPHHSEIDQVTSEVAVRTGASLFDRGALMDQWRLDGHPYAEFLSDDGVHHNDRGYQCVAQALATAILQGIGQPQTAGRSSIAHR